MSLTAARRRLALNPALHQPPWARAPVERVARRLLLAGRWNGARASDESVVRRLAGTSVEQLTEETAKYAAGDDPLLARIEASVSVISPYDAWLLLRGDLTSEDLRAFKETALEVLGARDPGLDLPPNERYQANVVGKARPHTDDLREGIGTSLALLGSLGDRQLADSGMTGADWARHIVAELLTKANEAKTADIWASLDDVLPLLAEAAPDEFLRAVGKGLESSQPLLAGIFVDKDLGIFGNASHTGLLWALEILAWSPDHLGPAVDLLAGLAEIDPGGRMANRPFRSLDEIFCPWHPQNSADNKRRLDVVDGLRQRHPTIAWRLMLALLPESHAVGGYTHPPSYRTWKPAQEPPVLLAEYWSFIGGLVDRLLEDVGEDAARWVDVVNKVDDLPPEMRELVLKQLGIVADAKLDESARGQIHEAMSSLVRKHREFDDADWALETREIDRIAAVADRFQPDSPLLRHAWLFADQMPSLDVERKDNWENYQKELARIRAEAVSEIAESSSWDEFLSFVRESKVPGELGAATSQAGVKKYETEVLKLLDSEQWPEYGFARGYAMKEIEKDPSWFDRVIAAGGLSPRQHAGLLLSLWDRPKEWERLDSVAPEVAKEYWREFPQFPGRMTGEELRKVGEGLRSVGRIGAALDLLAMCVPKEGEDAQLAELVATLLQEFLDRGDEKGVRLPGYDFARLFKFLDRSPSIDRDRIARLEWLYLPALEHEGRSFALHRAMAEDPYLFAELICRMFKPRREDSEADGSEAEEEAQEPDEAAKNVATNAYRLLSRWRMVPGTRDNGQVDATKLRQWVAKARRELADRKRAEVGDVFIGHILAHGPSDSDGLWPTLPIRDLIEEFRSDDVEDGFRTETYNSRGITSRALGGGGTQERELVGRYEELSDKVSGRWPRTGMMLRAIAESYKRDARQQDERAERFRKGWEGPGAGRVQAPREDVPTQNEVVYFAYGSNMSSKRLEKRLGSLKKRGVGKLAESAIAFDKRSQDGSGKTNVVQRKSGEVWGVLVGLTPEQMQALAKIEKGYVEKTITVSVGGKPTTVRTFVAEKRDRGLRPTPRYLSYLIEGAKEHGLPASYVKKLERVRTQG